MLPNETWKVSEKYPGYIYKTVVIGSSTNYIYRPILTPEEEEKRGKEILEALGRCMLRERRTREKKEITILRFIEVMIEERKHGNTK